MLYMLTMVASYINKLFGRAIAHKRHQYLTHSDGFYIPSYYKRFSTIIVIVLFAFGIGIAYLYYITSISSVGTHSMASDLFFYPGAGIILTAIYRGFAIFVAGWFVFSWLIKGKKHEDFIYVWSICGLFGNSNPSKDLLQKVYMQYDVESFARSYYLIFKNITSIMILVGCMLSALAVDHYDRVDKNGIYHNSFWSRGKESVYSLQDVTTIAMDINKDSKTEHETPSLILHLRDDEEIDISFQYAKKPTGEMYTSFLSLLIAQGAILNNKWKDEIQLYNPDYAYHDLFSALKLYH